MSHKKISVATSSDPTRPFPRGVAAPAEPPAPPPPAVLDPRVELPKRRLYFEDVEVRRSRSTGLVCRVTLKKGDKEFIGETEGVENNRSRIELAARAAVMAMNLAEGESRNFALEGCRSVEAFDREFVFVGVTVKVGREGALLTGSAEIRDSAETAAVLAVLASTNRWVEYERS